jgi:hypothetical protein
MEYLAYFYAIKNVPYILQDLKLVQNINVHGVKDYFQIG